MDVPVDPCPSVEAGVDVGEEAGGKPWREAGVDEVVEQKGEEHLVDMEGQRCEVEVFGDGRYGLSEQFGCW